MLSYRHAFHAGNHADVLKHLVLTLCLEYMNSKDKPYLLVDTHAGAGQYSLEGEHARRTGEFIQGVARLWDLKQLPPPVARYLALVRRLNGGGKLHRYPGSPWIAATLARKTDRLRLCELHSADFALLRRQYKGDAPRVTIEHEDGFVVLKAALPPLSRRGIVLIDPSYEIKSDYMKVVASLKDALKRFASGTYLVWHPLLPSIDANRLPEMLKKLGVGHWLHATLCIRAPATKGHGMQGSGMFIINPPWTLESSLEESLPFLANVLGQDQHASWHLDKFERDAKPSLQDKPGTNLSSERDT